MLRFYIDFPEGGPWWYRVLRRVFGRVGFRTSENFTVEVWQMGEREPLVLDAWASKTLGRSSTSVSYRGMPRIKRVSGRA